MKRKPATINDIEQKNGLAVGRTTASPHQEESKAHTKDTTMNTYQTKAQATKSRRQSRGLYKRPTKVQHDAFNKACQSRRLYGEPVFTYSELEALATHPYLSASQRSDYQAMLASVNWG